MAKKHHSKGLWDTKTMFHCSIVMFFLGGIATLTFYRNNNQEAATSSNVKIILTTTADMITHPNIDTSNTQVFDHQRRLKIALLSLTDTCDFFSGKWVHDNKSHYPLYKEDECPYLHGDLACLTYGRKDSKFQQWRWQPHGCDFPRFDGKAIVERLRGKRLLFVGDSVNRNQWDSMMCMLHSSIPGTKRVSMGGLNGTLYTFRASDYNISIDYYWAPMLVESNGDDPLNHRLDHRTIRIKSIEKHAKHWVDADVLVFNTYLWWRLPVIKLTATDWGGKKNEGCYGETEPVKDDRFWESGTNPKMLKILESSLSKLKAKGVNVKLINITQLTQCRKDAHPTVHRKLWRPLTEDQKKYPQRASDCTHWCLPGVPDIWNELLLAYIFPATETAGQ